jgi:hypothetical protein
VAADWAAIKKARQDCLTSLGNYALNSASTSVVNGKQIPKYLDGLEVAGRHFARLVVALQFEAYLLPFDKITHSGALNGRDMDKRVIAAVVRLNEAKAFGGVKPFNDASGHDEPFHSNTGTTTQ